MVSAALHIHDYHSQIPKDLSGNLMWRAAVLKRANADPDFADAVIQACRQDPLFWINTFCWTYDPRRKPFKKIPMITYGYQDTAVMEIVDAVYNGHDLLIEKSRDMGASWICMLAFVWFWTFYPMQSFLVVSRTESYVDERGNPKCLFWKADFILSNLPHWMRPRFDRTRLHLFNLDTGSVIDGESTTGDVARGDRRTAILLDEFAAVEQGHRVLRSTRDTTDCRIFNSTHQGTATAYYHQATKTDIRKLRMHWSLHPRKNIGLYTRRDGEYVAIDGKYWSQFEDFTKQMEDLDAKIAARGVPVDEGKLRSPWYAEQCDRAAHAVEIAQELDIDCLGSSYQFFSQVSIEDHIKRNACAPFHVGDLEFDQDTLDPIAWRENPRGRMKLWFHLDDRGFPLNCQAAIGADVSAGTGASNSALSGISKVAFEKVFEYACPHIRPEAFGRLTVAVCRWLYNAHLIWEMNGPGRQFGDSVIEAGYRNIYYRRDEETVLKNMSDVPGWAPTTNNKLALLGEYRRALELQTLINRSEISLRDCLEYVYLPNGSVEHAQATENIDPTGARSNHGDRTIADALAWKLVKDRPKVSSTSSKSVPANSFAGRRAKYLRKKRLASTW